MFLCVCVCAHSTSWLTFACISSRRVLICGLNTVKCVCVSNDGHYDLLIMTDLILFSQPLQVNSTIQVVCRLKKTYIISNIRIPIVKAKKTNKQVCNLSQVPLFHYGSYTDLNYFPKWVFYCRSSAELTYIGTKCHF